MSLTYAEIVTLANQEAKTPGYLDQAGQYLNLVLQDLALNYRFDIRHNDIFTITTGTVSPPEGPYALPSDYVSHVEGEIRFIENGQPYVLFQVPLRKLKHQFTGQGFTTYPQVFATDVSDQANKKVFFWPPPNGAYVIEFPYYMAHEFIADPATSSEVPWFPSSDYLIKATAAKLCRSLDDDRAEKYRYEAEADLTKYMKMMDDKEGYAQRVQLDPNNFLGRGDLKGTKQNPWGN